MVGGGHQLRRYATRAPSGPAAPLPDGSGYVRIGEGVDEPPPESTPTTSPNMSAHPSEDFDPESHTAGENFESSKEHALEAAEELKAAASQKVHDLRDAALERSQRLRDIATQRADELRRQASETGEHFRDVAEERWDQAQTQFDDLRQEGERYVRRNPAKAVLIALGLGFVIGRILR